MLQKLVLPHNHCAWKGSAWYRVSHGGQSLPFSVRTNLHGYLLRCYDCLSPKDRIMMCFAIDFPGMRRALFLFTTPTDSGPAFVNAFLSLKNLLYFTYRHWQMENLLGPKLLRFYPWGQYCFLIHAYQCLLNPVNTTWGSALGHIPWVRNVIHCSNSQQSWERTGVIVVVMLWVIAVVLLTFIAQNTRCTVHWYIQKCVVASGEGHPLAETEQGEL